MTTPEPPPTDPPLYLINGNATDEEIAAVLAVLQSAAAAVPPAPEGSRPVSAWASPARSVRRALHHGPGGWRASALPH